MSDTVTISCAAYHMLSTVTISCAAYRTVHERNVVLPVALDWTDRGAYAQWCASVERTTLYEKCIDSPDTRNTCRVDEFPYDATQRPRLIDANKNEFLVFLRPLQLHTTTRRIPTELTGTHRTEALAIMQHQWESFVVEAYAAHGVAVSALRIESELGVPVLM